MDVEERRALRLLPRLMRDRANKAAHGSIEDLESLYAGITKSTPHTHQRIVLAVFFVHLDPVSIPTQTTPESEDIITRATWSLQGIQKTLFHCPVHDALLSKWDRLFPWMQFFYTNFFWPTSNRRQNWPVSIPNGIIGQTMITLLSSLCQSTEDVRRAIRSMPDVVTMIVDFWTAIVDADLCCMGIESESRMPELVLLTLRVSVTLPMAACVASESRTEPVPLPLITRAAGGVERVVITALKYIRMITRGMPHINPREALSRYTPGHYMANSVCFSHCVRFLLSASRFDPVLREAWISRGSIQIVTMAIKRLSRRILVKHGDGLADDPDSGLEYRRSLLEGGYIYLKFALQSVDDGVTVACQSLQSGLLETILQFGSSDSANSSRFRRMHNADLALLGDITRYFVYERVLIVLSKSLEKIVSQNIESHARRDASLYAAWMDVKETAFRNLRIKASVAKDVHPLYAPGCASPDCSAHGTMGGDAVLWRCSGCLVSAYCPKACQRSHWDEEHRTVCNIARHGLGTQGSRDLRRSIPTISLIETMQGLSDGGRIDALVAEAQHKTPADRDRLVVELDMTMVPPEFKVRRFDDYLELFVPDFWKEIEGTMRMSQQATGNYLAVVVKVPDGNRAHTLWSPKTALAWGFGWGPGGDSHWLQTRKFMSSLPG